MAGYERDVEYLNGVVPRLTLRILLVVLGVVAVVWLAMQLASVLFLVFIAGILAAGAIGPVGWLESRGLPTVVAVIVVYLAIGGALVVAIIVIAPPVIGQLAEMARSLPDAIDRLGARSSDVLASLGLGTGGASLLDVATNQLRSVAGVIPSIPFAIVDGVAKTLSAIFLSVLLILERHQARDWVLRLIAPDDRETLLDLTHQAVDRLGAYIRGQLLVMTVTGTASAVGLTVIGVPFPFALGLLAFLTEAIPLAGPIIAGAVMIAVALTESPGHAIATLVLVIAIQQLEGLVLVPQIQGRVISISPAVALVGVLSGSALAGIGGALIAIPVIAISKVVLDEVVIPWRRRHIRHDESPPSRGADRRLRPCR